MAEPGDYCSFSKAVEQFGDRWSLLVIRELVIHGTCGFNALVAGLPGVSRSLLAARLRGLEEVELIERDPTVRRGVPGYRLTAAGRELEPTLGALRAWSQRCLPQDPAIAERDPDIVTAWLAHRAMPAALPERPAVVQIDMGGPPARRFWVVLERGQDAAVCIEDPLLDPGRYAHLEASAPALLPLARGLRSWSDAIADGSVRLFGEPELVHGLPGWSVPVSAPRVRRGMAGAAADRRSV